jgi:hypothetical protein
MTRPHRRLLLNTHPTANSCHSACSPPAAITAMNVSLVLAEAH